MSGGVPKRILITQTQRNTPSKAGNAVPKKAIVACSGEKSRTALCNYVRKRTNVLTPLQTSYSWSTQMTAADLSGGSPAPIDGFSAGAPGGPAAGGSLNPSGTTWTEVLLVLTHDGPVWPASGAKQLPLRAIGVHVPASITITGGDLSQSYTLKTNEADVKPPSTADIWIWYSTFSQPGSGFLFTPGVTYTLIFN